MLFFENHSFWFYSKNNYNEDSVIYIAVFLRDCIFIIDTKLNLTRLRKKLIVEFNRIHLEKKILILQI
jgi:hypothetical protein